MNQERLLKVIVSPHVSEKSAIVGDKYKQVVFKVATDATKPEVKAAVEQLFNVEVSAVRTCIKKPKTKRFGQRMGTRKKWKKAYVSLKEGFDINFVSGSK